MPKLETTIVLNESSYERLFSVFKNHQRKLASYSPIIKSVEVLDSTSSSSVVLFQKFVEGKLITMKERIEIDEEKKSITATTLKGEVVESYDLFRSIVQIVRRQGRSDEDEEEEGSGGGVVVKATIDYEKKNANVPTPTKYLDIWVNLIKDVARELK